MDTAYIIKIQRWYRECILRLKRLPTVLYFIQYYLKNQAFTFSQENEDGRVNSSLDETEVISLLIKILGNRIVKPKMRMWYDILVLDYRYGWLPVNIKTTTTKNNDNVGNLTMCVYSYTNYHLDLQTSYNNREMSRVLFEKLKNKAYNTLNKKDYYFIVLNKTDHNDIIINSLKGLSILCANNNNLPFQVGWSKNRHFQYGNIKDKVKLFIDTLKKPNPSWQETFMNNIRSL